MGRQISLQMQALSSDATSQCEEEVTNSSVVSLRLKAAKPPRGSVQWTDDTVDNEGLGRKSSKSETAFLRLPIDNGIQVAVNLKRSDNSVRVHRTIPVGTRAAMATVTTTVTPALTITHL